MKIYFFFFSIGPLRFYGQTLTFGCVRRQILRILYRIFFTLLLTWTSRENLPIWKLHFSLKNKLLLFEGKAKKHIFRHKIKNIFSVLISNRNIQAFLNEKFWCFCRTLFDCPTHSYFIEYIVWSNVFSNFSIFFTHTRVF